MSRSLDLRSESVDEQLPSGWFEGFHNRLVSNRIGSAVESRFPESTMKMFKKPELSGLILLLLCEI